METLDKEDYNSLYSQGKGIEIGVNLFDSDNTIILDVNKLIPSHIGIFGNTGSGKSNTLSKLLKKYLEIIPNDYDKAKVLIFDLNNEYGKDAIVSQSKKTLYTLNTRNNPQKYIRGK